jgi:3-deoxy-manno-octulosonate cytidylyltransferase (CMP-KDO synthetase)
MAPENVDLAVETLLAGPDREIATLTVPLPPAHAGDPNVVKAAVARDGRALYFSRAAIPHPRQGAPAYRKHLGIYAFRARTLERLAALPPSPLEQAESLEQLRWLEGVTRSGRARECRIRSEWTRRMTWRRRRGV